MLLPCIIIEMTHTAACESISGNDEQKHTQKRLSITERGLVQISFSARAERADWLGGMLCSGEPAMRRRKIDLSRAAPRREAGGVKIAAAAHLTHKKWNQN